MTWAEFRIRSFAFNRIRKWDMHLTREVSYEVHTLKYLFGKAKPPRKEKFWPIEGERKQKISDKQRERLIQAYKAYKQKKDANGFNS